MLTNKTTITITQRESSPDSHPECGANRVMALPPMSGGGPHHQLVRHFDDAWVDGRTLDQAEQDFRGVFSHFPDGLIYGCDIHQFGDRLVVKADDGDVFGYPDPVPLRLEDKARGHLVAAREQGGGFVRRSEERRVGKEGRSRWWTM